MRRIDQPVRVVEPHFRVFEEFRASYAERYTSS
jgi:hypothetical protein